VVSADNPLTYRYVSAWIRKNALVVVHSIKEPPGSDTVAAKSESPVKESPYG